MRDKEEKGESAIVTTFFSFLPQLATGEWIEGGGGGEGIHGVIKGERSIPLGIDDNLYSRNASEKAKGENWMIVIYSHNSHISILSEVASVHFGLKSRQAVQSTWQVQYEQWAL